MADPKANEAKGKEAPAPAGNKRKRLILIGGIAGALLLGGGAAGFMLIGGGDGKKKKGGRKGPKPDEEAQAHDDAHDAGDEAQAGEEDADPDHAAADEKPGGKAAADDSAATPGPQTAGAERTSRRPKRRPYDPDHVPVFVELDTFTVNLADPVEERVLQTKMALEVKDAAAGDALKTIMPALRSDILMLLGAKDSKQIGSREGKEQLAAELLALSNDRLRGSPFARGVLNVHFQHLIVQ